MHLLTIVLIHGHRSRLITQSDGIRDFTPGFTDSRRNQRTSLTPTESVVAACQTSSSMDVGGPSLTNESATNIVPRSTRSISPRNRKQYLRPDLDTIRETIRAYTDPTNIHRAPRIADDLHRYFQTLETSITGLRTLSVTKILQ